MFQRSNDNAKLTDLLTKGGVPLEKQDFVFGFAQTFYTWKNSVLNPYCLEQCLGHDCCDFGTTRRGLMNLTEPELRAVFQLGSEQTINQETLGVPVVLGYSLVKGYLIADSDESPAKRECVVMKALSPDGRLAKTYTPQNFDKCPAFKDKQCVISNHPAMPYMCKAYPIDFGVTAGFGIYMDVSCPGIREVDLAPVLQDCKEFDIPLIRITPFPGKIAMLNRLI